MEWIEIKVVRLISRTPGHENCPYWRTSGNKWQLSWRKTPAVLADFHVCVEFTLRNDVRLPPFTTPCCASLLLNIFLFVSLLLCCFQDWNYWCGLDGDVFSSSQSMFGLLLFCPSVSKRCSRSGKTEPRARFQPRHGFIMRKQSSFLQHPPLIQASVADAVRFSNVYVTMCLVSKMRQMGSAVLKTSDFLTHGLVNHSAGALWMHDQYFKHTLPLQGRCSLLSNNIWRLYAWLLPSSNSYKTIISFNEKLVSAGVWATVAEASLLQLLLASTWRF